jgi:Uma2 family endonuclease
MPETPATRILTAEQYLEFENNSNARHEYVDGQVFAMTGGTAAHAVICSNLLAIIHSHLRGTGCRAFTNSMKVHVKAANSFYYPDIMVTCEPFVAKSTFTVSPVVIVEVLSPSTKQIDCREKLVAYRKLESLRQYVLVHQNKMLIEVYTKGVDGSWQASQLRRPDELALEFLPGGVLAIPVPEIYGEVEPPSVVSEEEEEYEAGSP